VAFAAATLAGLRGLPPQARMLAFVPERTSTTQTWYSAVVFLQPYGSARAHGGLGRSTEGVEKWRLTDRLDRAWPGSCRPI